MVYYSFSQGAHPFQDYYLEQWHYEVNPHQRYSYLFWLFLLMVLLFFSKDLWIIKQLDSFIFLQNHLPLILLCLDPLLVSESLFQVELFLFSTYPFQQLYLCLSSLHFQLLIQQQLLLLPPLLPYVFIELVRMDLTFLFKGQDLIQLFTYLLVQDYQQVHLSFFIMLIQMDSFFSHLVLALKHLLQLIPLFFFIMQVQMDSFFSQLQQALLQLQLLLLLSFFVILVQMHSIFQLYHCQRIF